MTSEGRARKTDPGDGREERTAAAAEVEQRPGPRLAEGVDPLPGPTRGRQDVGDLAATEVGRDAGRQVEVTLQEAAEVEAIVRLVEPAGELPVVAIGQEGVVGRPQVRDAAQGGEGRAAGET